MLRDKKREHTLIKNVVNGDSAAFDELFNTYNQKVYEFSLCNLKSVVDAECVVQEVFLSLWKDRAKIGELNDLDAWIFSICYNIIRKRFRKLKREREHLHKFFQMNGSLHYSTSNEVEYNDLLKKAEIIIDQLPTRQKSVFLLSKNEGLSNSDISEKLNISKKTVENHLTRAKSFIKSSLVSAHLI